MRSSIPNLRFLKWIMLRLLDIFLLFIICALPRIYPTHWSILINKEEWSLFILDDVEEDELHQAQVKEVYVPAKWIFWKQLAHSHTSQMFVIISLVQQLYSMQSVWFYDFFIDMWIKALLISWSPSKVS